MEPKGSLLHSQELDTCPYPEPEQSRPCPPIPFFKKIHFLGFQYATDCLTTSSKVLPEKPNRSSKSTPPVPIVSHSSTVHAIPSHFWEIHCNMIHLSLGLPSGLFLSVLPIKALYVPLLSPIHATCPAHFISSLFACKIFGG
jgi:hypothetical protein